MEEASYTFVNELSKISLEISQATAVLQQQMQDTSHSQGNDDIDMIQLNQKLQTLPQRIKQLEGISEDVCKRRDDLVCDVAAIMSENVKVIQNLQEKAQLNFTDQQSEEINSNINFLHQINTSN